MSKQVLDIEQIKYLHELGLDTSKASMQYVADNNDIIFVVPKECGYHIKDVEDGYIICGALTLQDILDLLPKEMTPMPTDRIKFKLCIYGGAIFYCFKDGIDDILVQFRIDENGLIDAAYEMLCWCIENGYIETNKQ